MKLHKYKMTDHPGRLHENILRMRRCDKCKLVQNALTDFGNLGLSFLPSNTRGYSTNTETTCHTCKTAGTILPADCTRIRDQLVIVRVATEHPFLPTFRIVVTLQNSGTSNIGPEILDRLKENVVLLHAWSNVWFERMGDGGVYHVVNDINTITFSRDEVDTLDSTLELQLRMHGLLDVYCTSAYPGDHHCWRIQMT